MLQLKLWHWTKTSTAKKIFSMCRWLHVYLSTFLFSLLIFFCITGFTLNHADWFSSNARQGIEKYTIPEPIQHALQSKDSFPSKLLTDFIKQKFGLDKPRSIDRELDIGEISLDYPLPAGYAFITLQLQKGEITVDYRKGHWVTLFNDLHKGRHTGFAWSVVIDICAISMTLFSLAGLTILFQHKKYRSYGMLVFIAGSLTPIAIYYFYVPSY